MEFTIASTVLNDVLKSVGRAVSNKSLLPILTGIKVSATHNKITFVGSDSNLIIQREVQEHTEVISEGSVVIPARHFSAISRKLPGNLHIRCDRNNVSITSGEIETTLNGMDAEEYPMPPQMEQVEPIKISGGRLMELIKSTVFAVSKNETNAGLTGVQLSFNEGEVIAAATNSHRLAYKKIIMKTGGEGSVVIPGEVLSELVNILNEDDQVEIFFTDAHVEVKTLSYSFYSRLINGRFPRVTELISIEPIATIDISRKAFLQSLERACLFASDWQNNNVTLNMDSATMVTIRSNATAVGAISEKIKDVKHSGEIFSITFDGQFMLDALKAIKSENIRVQLSGTMKPIHIIPVNHTDHVHLISPVRT